MICPNCKAWSGPAEFSCYNCSEDFVPWSDVLGPILLFVLYIAALVLSLVLCPPLSH